MSRQLHFDQAAEREANEIAFRFMDSSDVVGDMSRAYGADLSSVRIHTDESAARKVENTGADAVSTGRDVFFGRGVFDRSDPASRGLLAHELAHSLQQGVGGGMEGAMEQSAPEGAAQGGLIDWFREHFTASGREQRRKRKAMPWNVKDRMPGYGPGKLGSNMAADIRGMAQNTGLVEGLDSKYGDGSGNWMDRLDTITRMTPEVRDVLRSGKGSLMSGFGVGVSQYMQNLENGGLDFGEVMAGAKDAVGIPQGTHREPFKQSAKLGQMGSDMLNMLDRYLGSDQGIQYLRAASGAMKDSRAFGGITSNALNYLLRGLIVDSGKSASNSVESEHNAVKRAHMGYKNGVEAQNATKAVFDLLGKMPELANMGMRDKERLDPEVQKLLEQYENMLLALGNRIG